MAFKSTVTEILVVTAIRILAPFATAPACISIDHPRTHSWLEFGRAVAIRVVSADW